MATTGSSFRFRFTNLMAIAFAGVVALIAGAFDRVLGTLLEVRHRMEKVFLRAVAAFKVDMNQITLQLPLVAFVRARAFVLRLAKRERPTVLPSWRMCAST